MILYRRPLQITAIGDILFGLHFFQGTVKPVLSGHLKTDKTKVLKENSLMRVESKQNAPLGILQFF